MEGKKSQRHNLPKTRGTSKAFGIPDSTYPPPTYHPRQCLAITEKGTGKWGKTLVDEHPCHKGVQLEVLECWLAADQQL